MWCLRFVTLTFCDFYVVCSNNSYVKWRLRYVMLRFVAVPFSLLQWESHKTEFVRPVTVNLCVPLTIYKTVYCLVDEIVNWKFVHAALILLANSKFFFIPNLVFLSSYCRYFCSMETPMQKAAFALENTFRKPPMMCSISWVFRASDERGNRR
jgi:hypothetical protein